jgi:hypothetical protein
MAGRPQNLQIRKDIRRAPSYPQSPWFVSLSCSLMQDESIAFRPTIFEVCVDCLTRSVLAQIVFQWENSHGARWP